MKDLWKHTRLYCTGHDKPHLMEPVQQGLMCSGEDGCGIIVAYSDAMKMIEKISDIMDENLASFVTCDYRNMPIADNKYDIRILKYEPGDLKIGIRVKP